MNDPFLIPASAQRASLPLGRRGFLAKVGAASVAAIVCTHIGGHHAQAGLGSWLKSKFSALASWASEAFETLISLIKSALGDTCTQPQGSEHNYVAGENGGSVGSRWQKIYCSKSGKSKTIHEGMVGLGSWSF
jgi:hypothetical protein